MRCSLAGARSWPQDSTFPGEGLSHVVAPPQLTAYAHVSSSAHAVVVPAHGKAIVKTDLAIATPLDCYARIGKIR